MALKSLEPIYFTPPPLRGRYASLWKDSPSPPKTPDPIKTAEAQGQANIDAARTTTQLNRFDQVTPYGSMTWQQGGAGKTFDQSGYDAAMKQYALDMQKYQQQQQQSGMGEVGNGAIAQRLGVFGGGGAGGSGTAPVAPNYDSFMRDYSPDKWTSTTTLDPRVQSLMDQNLAASAGLQDAVTNSLGRVNETFSKGLDTSKLPTPTSGWDAYQRASGEFTSPDAQIALAQGRYGDANSVAGQTLDRFGQVAGTPFDYRNAPEMPTANEATRKAVEDALYRRSTSRLDPQFAQTTNDLQSRLAAQGITQGSEAYNREAGNLGRARTDAYQQALDSAVANSGTEMQRLFTMGLAGRQQGVAEENALRALPLQEALAGSGLLGQAGQGLQGLLGTEMGQNQAANAIATGAYNTDAAARQAGLGEQLQQRQQILNELNALRTGAQTAMPQFQGQGGGATAAPAPIAQSISNAYQGDMNAYNAQVGSQNSMMGGLASLAGSALMAPAGTFGGATGLLSLFR